MQKTVIYPPWCSAGKSLVFTDLPTTTFCKQHGRNI